MTARLFFRPRVCSVNSISYTLQEQRTTLLFNFFQSYYAFLEHTVWAADPPVSLIHVGLIGLLLLCVTRGSGLVLVSTGSGRRQRGTRWRSGVVRAGRSVQTRPQGEKQHGSKRNLKICVICHILLYLIHIISNVGCTNGRRSTAAITCD